MSSSSDFNKDNTSSSTISKEESNLKKPLWLLNQMQATRKLLYKRIENN